MEEELSAKDTTKLPASTFVAFASIVNGAGAVIPCAIPCEQTIEKKNINNFFMVTYDSLCLAYLLLFSNYQFVFAVL